MKKKIPRHVFIILSLFFKAFILTFSGCKKAEAVNTNVINRDTTKSSDGVSIIDTNMLSFSSTKELLEGSILLNQNQNPDFTIKKWQGIPSIAIDKHGLLYSVWYSGGKGENPGNYIILSVSEDNGQSWLPNSLIVAPQSGTDVRFFDPNLWRAPDGNLYLFWTKSHNNWDQIGGVWSCKILYLNGVIKYSTPKRIADGIMMNKPIYCSNDGAILFPISIWAPSPKTGTFVYKTTFNKTNFSFTSITKFSDIPFAAADRNFDEHSIVQNSETSFSCYLRGVKGVYTSQSTDACKTWTVPVRLTSLGSLNSSRSSVKRLKSGNLLFILNESASRDNITALLSKDNGATWPYKLVLDKRLNVSYPDETQADDGTIYVVYDRERLTLKEIDLASFTEDDIINGNTQNIKRSIVSN